MRRLRLLYVGPFNSPHVEDVALAMHERGHDVHVGGQVWAGGLPPSSLPSHGIPVYEMTSGVRWMRRIFRNLRPDIVHAHWMPFATTAAMAGVRPLVATAWGSDIYALTRRRTILTSFALRRTALATADSAHLLRRMEELGPKSLRTSLLNWGVDLNVMRLPTTEERARSKALLGLGAGPVIFSPRGLQNLYNPDIVVEAFTRVHSARPDATLLLKHSGDADLARSDWSTVPGLHVIGRVDDTQMKDLFRASDVTLSIPSSDSSPRSVWEAMAVGSLLILSDLPWVHELIVDGRDALVVTPTPEEVAAAIETALQTPNVYMKIVTSARSLVERHRNRDVELDRLEAFYAELANR
ncbi:MAG TPA: glycosyltransferase family 4 protein [Gaiellaceae bacterium]|nr:glycosyltransferase family 4 protein [Gaiellaceae bacterium]